MSPSSPADRRDPKVLRDFSIVPRRVPRTQVGRLNGELAWVRILNESCGLEGELSA
jgi:hypothetical protein